MPYYFETVESHFRIERENLGPAYDALCALNAREELKSGGGWPPAEKPEDSKSVARGPSRYFRFMPWNYDEVFKSAVEILEALGFDVEQDERGICGIRFEYQKSGDEEAILSALGPFVEKGSYLVFEGEDMSVWGYEFDGEKMQMCGAYVKHDPILPGMSPSPSSVAGAAAAVVASVVSAGLDGRTNVHPNVGSQKR